MIPNSEASVIATYSNIQDEWEGEGNIDLDPLFTDPENDDYTLMEGSPSIDTGIEIEDMEYFGSAPDMGAFEYGVTDNIMLGDTNFDGNVNILDILIIVNYIMGNIDFTEAEFQAANYNGDDVINILDILQIINYILS